MIKPLYSAEIIGQLDMAKAFDFAVRNKKIVFVIDKHGSGFHFARRRFNMAHPDLRVAEYTLSSGIDNDSTISMFRELDCDIKVVNKNYKRMNPHDFLVALTNRAKLDLRGKKVLIVFDRFEKLQSEHSFKKFFKYIQLLKLPCGIIIRTTSSHVRMIRDNYRDIFAYINQFDRKNVREITEEDVQAFCDCYGLSNKILREQISKQSKDLRIVYQYISKSKNLPEVSQLALFG
jgi:hypothetical protein